MRSARLTVRLETRTRKRLESLAEVRGRSCSFLAAEAINDYLDATDWQIASINRAIVSLDCGEGIAHGQVKQWVESWDRPKVP